MRLYNLKCGTHLFKEDPMKEVNSLVTNWNKILQCAVIKIIHIHNILRALTNVIFKNLLKLSKIMTTIIE